MQQKNACYGGGGATNVRVGGTSVQNRIIVAGCGGITLADLSNASKFSFPATDGRTKSRGAN